PSQLYRTRDGYIFIMCNKEKFWPILCQKLGHPEWAADPRFATFRDRLANRCVLNGMLDAALGERNTADWLEAFAGIIPAAPVNDIKAALENPYLRERGQIRDYAHPTAKAVRMVSTPISWTGDAPRRAAPGLGADTADILGECGFSERDIRAFRADGVV
ncbi:MAG TPA: CoA transferase, partial [Stellaceae bacterium]|nr:CoA transferase [Stellaceae bacterium]